MTPLFSTDDLQPSYERFLSKRQAVSAAEEAVDLIEFMLAEVEKQPRTGNAGVAGSLAFEAVPHVQYMGASDHPELADILALVALESGPLRQKVERFRILLRRGNEPSGAEQNLWDECLAAWEAWLSFPEDPWPDRLACSAGL